MARACERRAVAAPTSEHHRLAILVGTVAAHEQGDGGFV
jgi:hypothetical protein